MQRLAGSQEWQEFAASCDVHPLPADIGNRDEYRTGFWPGFVGLSFRFYNPETRLWSIYWTDSRKRLAVLEPPVVGAFVDGVGLFETRDEFEGRAIVVRYTWTRTDTETPHWEQAFSPDDGLTWEVNWVMDMERAAS